ncbi:NAD(P)/FAD-dependent oxidoreductase [Paraconexibacter sp.]|uniref:type III sulfide quinone reductase, selenoprotein subtype n=1 Tax=Paraconexibacter sp. TaxID=2949640 RepID=UPI003566111B
MPTRIVILGAGTGGTLTANRLRRACDDDVEIVVVDRDDRHVYQPGLLFVPFGLAESTELVRSRRAQLHDGIDFRIAEVEQVDLPGNRVHLDDGSTVDYDVLVVASGAVLQPEETEGLPGPGWGRNVFTFFEAESAQALHTALQGFDRGRIVVNPIDMPIKCPVAPLEFCFLLDWYLHQRGVRDDVELTYVTCLDGAFTKPVASERLSSLLADKGIEVVTEFATGEVDAEHGRLVSYDEREVPFDLLVTIPLHGGPSYVGRSPGLGDEFGFVPTDPRTLQARAADNVFAIGDATNLPASKAGSVTHFEGDTVVANIQHFLAGEDLEATFDGHSNCFIETGFHKALLIDFNYDREPLPGRYPDAHVGPLPLLKESRMNHIAKLLFQWVYWHALLPGHDIPGISAQMQHAAKDPALTGADQGTPR